MAKRKRPEYVAHPDDFAHFNRVRKAMNIKPLDRPDPDCPRGCVQVILHDLNPKIERTK